jgi:PAS domain-containing protein
VSRFVTDHLRDSRPFRSVYRIRTKRDAYMWVSVTFNTFRFGNARYLYAQYTDIDDVKRQEELLEEQYNAAQTFLDSVAGSYLVARRANLTHNRVETIQGTNPLPQVAAEKNYDLSMALLLQAIPGEEERRECEAYFTRSALLRAFEAGKRSLSREYQYRSPEGEVKWVRSTITLTRRPGSGDVIAFSAASDITEEKLIRAVMDQVVAKQYDYFCCIDAAHDRISLLVSNTETLPPSRVGSGTPYEASVRAYNNEYVVPAERESCNAFANDAKTEFLSRMSHDIRTPLNGIIGMTYLAQAQESGPHRGLSSAKIDTSSKFLLGLINDVLDMAKAESGKIELHPEPYPPGSSARLPQRRHPAPVPREGQNFLFEPPGPRPACAGARPAAASTRSCSTCSPTPIKYTPGGRHHRPTAHRGPCRRCRTAACTCASRSRTTASA